MFSPSKQHLLIFAGIAITAIVIYFVAPRLFGRRGRREGFQATPTDPVVSPAATFSSTLDGNKPVPPELIGNAAACEALKRLLEPLNVRIADYEAKGQNTDELTLMRTTKASLEEQLSKMQCPF
jgi:hypothetical protein